MDAAKSLRKLFGGRIPRVWTLQVAAKHDEREHAWEVDVRTYYLEYGHAANVSPEVAEVLGLEYRPGRCAIRLRTRFAGSAARVLVQRLSRALYGDEQRIRWHRME